MIYRFFICALVLVMSGQSVAAQSIRDGIIYKTWNDFKHHPDPSSLCPNVPWALYPKIDHDKYPNESLTDAEYDELVGAEHPYFGIMGGTRYYHKKDKKLWGIGESYLLMNGYDIMDPKIYSDPALGKFMQGFTPDKIDGNIPILCGNGEQERRMDQVMADAREKEKAERAEYERTCALCTLPGGRLLQAIYDGDYKKQHEIAGKYIGQVLLAGGSEGMALSTILRGLGGGADLSMIEELIGYYMLSSSTNWNQSCFANGSYKRKFTTTYPAKSYETLNGISMGSDPAVTNTTHYIVRPKFTNACNVLCNKNGNILLTAAIAGGFSQKLDAMEVFKGVSQLVKEYDCNSAQVKQFEDNLLSMWAQEKAAPVSERYNSLGKILQ